MKIWPFVYYYQEKKHGIDIFSVLFPQQLDDHESMNMAKIWTNKMLMMSTAVFEVFR